MSSAPPPVETPKLDLPRRGGSQRGGWVDYVEVAHNGKKYRSFLPTAPDKKFAQLKDIGFPRDEGKEEEE